MAREACEARSHPGVGTVHWPIFGQNVSPYSLPQEVSRFSVVWDAPVRCVPGVLSEQSRRAGVRPDRSSWGVAAESLLVFPGPCRGVAVELLELAAQ